jgi:xanthine dehydrogenase accessory factor
VSSEGFARDSPGRNPSVMDEIAARAEQLRRERVPFVHARVVLAEKPTSAHPGDEAIVLPDGTMEGFVGGDCAESTVRAQALAVLDSGESVVLRISPTAEDPVPGKLMAHNPCLSGGTLEIFLEPRRPPPLVAVAGDSPIARALVHVGGALGYEVVGTDPAEPIPDGAVAVVVATHGRDETGPLVAALEAGVAYVGLVASPKRGSAVVGGLDVDDALRRRVTTPAGLDIGARTPEEVAMSILADIVARRPRPSARPVGGESLNDTTGGQHAPGGGPGARSGTAADPVCGMAVAATESSLHLDHEGRRYFFCGTGCLRAFAAEPAVYTDSLES